MLTLFVRCWLLLALAAFALLWSLLAAGPDEDDVPDEDAPDDQNDSDDTPDEAEEIAGHGDDLADEWEDSLPDWFQ
jgi:hypothetical protein